MSADMAEMTATVTRDMTAMVTNARDRTGHPVPMIEVDPDEYIFAHTDDDPDKIRALLEAFIYREYWDTYANVVIPGVLDGHQQAMAIALEFYEQLGNFSDQASADIDRLTEEGKP